ncbi:WD40-repeat-containing domain protein [Melanogaster broomeanus]|nr:WD40-repeat-containing domain protein [Melanogaster broomeanus]
MPGYVKQWQSPRERRLRMWDLWRQVQATKPSQMRNPHDPITCVAWLTHKNDIQEILCGGTGLRYVILWRQRADATTKFDEVWSRRICSGHEIMHVTCETFDTNTRIATATRNKGVQLWSLDSKYHLSNIFSVERPTTVPRTLCFHGGDIVVFGMYDREIGGAAMDQTHTYFIIDNIITGYSLHRMDGTCIQTYDTKPSRTYPKQVVFSERGERIIGGGEDSKVFVFNKASGELKQTLQHSNRGRVQTLSPF